MIIGHAPQEGMPWSTCHYIYGQWISSQGRCFRLIDCTCYNGWNLLVTFIIMKVETLSLKFEISEKEIENFIILTIVSKNTKIKN